MVQGGSKCSAVAVSIPMYIAEARLQKALDLAAMLERFLITADEAARMTQDQWVTAAAAARVRVPSVDTQSIVIQLLQFREAGI